MIESRFYFASPAKKLEQTDIEHIVQIIGSVDTAAFLISNGCIENNDPDILSNLVKTIQNQGVAVLISDDVATMNILGADGVQIGSDIKHFEDCRKALGENFIIGAYVGASKHDAMLFGEKNADYIAFGPDYLPEQPNENNQGIIDLCVWWQEMFSLPAIAYLDATQSLSEIRFSSDYPDFVALLPNFWEIEDKQNWLNELTKKPISIPLG